MLLAIWQAIDAVAMAAFHNASVFFARQINSQNNVRNDFAVIQRTIWL